MIIMEGASQIQSQSQKTSLLFKSIKTPDTGLPVR